MEEIRQKIKLKLVVMKNNVFLILIKKDKCLWDQLEAKENKIYKGLAHITHLNLKIIIKILVKKIIANYTKKIVN